MKVKLAYGTDGIAVEMPDESTTVVEPKYRPGVEDPVSFLRDVVRNPVSGPTLRDIARPGDKVAISICDGTRPQPRQLMIPTVLDELEGIVSPDDITVLVATGTHRGNTEDELHEMLGEDLLKRVRVINHDCRDGDSLVYLGEFGDGVPVWLNRAWVEADVKITTGFVEPHFFAGFSGGPKLVAPGLAALETVLTLHNAERIGSQKATWGIRKGNPVHDDVRAIAAGTGVHFAFDVILNREKGIVDAFAGEMFAMHDAACEVARDVAMVAFEEPFDVVVTTNSGYPLDQNLYQAVKGMSAAENAVREGGLIICAAECRDGLPGGSEYERVLASEPTMPELLRAIEERSETEPDQWQVQIQARVQSKAKVGVYSHLLSDDELTTGHVQRVADIEAAVRDAVGSNGGRVCVLPEGPQTIPYLVD